MEKRRKQAIVIKCLFLAVVLGFVMMFVVGMCRSDARFFVESNAYPYGFS